MCMDEVSYATAEVRKCSKSGVKRRYKSRAEISKEILMFDDICNGKFQKLQSLITDKVSRN